MSVAKKRVSGGQELVDGKPVYQCVLISDLWHLTQEQAAPPPVTAGGAWTACDVWADFKRGYDRRRPTCSRCVAIVATHEARHAVPQAPQQFELPIEKP